jgi:predicted alpha/beta superfamily hydrolase
VQALEYSIPGTEVRTLPRSANGRDYVLYVSLPSSYATSPEKRYPVVYACDGYWDFPLLNAELGNLSYDGAIPECILVGMAYGGTNPNVGALRQIDLTPWLPNASDSGHAAEFLSVIEKQIIPYVESQYRTNPSYRVLTGSSYGGIFTVFALFEKPGLFQGYIAPSPSLWWQGSYMKTVVTQYAAAHTSLAARLYLTWGSDESSSIRYTTKELFLQLRELKLTGLEVAAREMTGERHAGPKGESYNRGLRFVFAPLAPVPATGFDQGFSGQPTFVNLSTRGRVGAGEDALVGGLVIQGLVPKRVLIRAVGPTLANFKVLDPLRDPKITVTRVSTQEQVAVCDNWEERGDASDMVAYSRVVGACPLLTGSKDAAIILSLEPGLYTVTVESADGGTGVALMEAYEMIP